jgi:hypothetical protein
MPDPSLCARTRGDCGLVAPSNRPHGRHSGHSRGTTPTTGIQDAASVASVEQEDSGAAAAPPRITACELACNEGCVTMSDIKATDERIRR